MYHQTKILPEQLEDEPETPFEVEYLLDIFFELNAGRSGGGFGANPLSFPDIQAWCNMTLFPLSFWEVRVLKRLDGVYLSHQAKKSKERSTRNKRK